MCTNNLNFQNVDGLRRELSEHYYVFRSGSIEKGRSRNFQDLFRQFLRVLAKNLKYTMLDFKYRQSTCSLTYEYIHNNSIKYNFTILSISEADLRYLLAGTSFSMATFEPNWPKLRSLDVGSIVCGIEISAMFVYLSQHHITSFLFCLVSKNGEEFTTTVFVGKGG